MITKLLHTHREFWTRRRLGSLAVGLFIFLASLFVQTQASYYSEHRALTSNFVTDLFLDNLPVVNVNFLIVQGAIIVIALAIFYGLYQPKYLVFGLKTIGILLFTRSLFVSLTHIGLYPGELIVNTANASYHLYKFFDFQGDYFFSAHTSVPFLIALILWPEKRWRLFFFTVSAVFGASVLLAHVHYSIDVFAAPFIAYGVFRFAQQAFPEDFATLASAPGLLTAEKSA